MDTAILLNEIAPFNLLPDSVKSKLASSISIRSFAAKELVFLEAEEGSYGYCVVDGQIAMVKTSPNGKELIVELVPPGELFGVVAFLQDRPYPLTARALCDTSVIAIPRRAVLPLLAEYPDLMSGLMRLISNRMQIAQNLARALSHDNVETRIATLLMALIPKVGWVSSNERLLISLSRQDLADMAGTTIESASRVIKTFERDGLLDASKVGELSILMLTGLQKLATEG